MSDIIDRYFDGGWVKYVLAMLVGAAMQRFYVEPQEADALVLGLGMGICLLILGLRWLNSR